MIDPVLASFDRDGSGLFVPSSVAKRRVIPYDDLSADGIPTQQAVITPELISTLAILVGQGPTVPRMIRSDDAGRVRVDADLNATTLVGRAQAVGDTQILLTDSTFFGPGDAFEVVPASGAAIHGPYQIKQVNASEFGLFDLFFGFLNAVAVGDSVRRFPLIAISAASQPLIITFNGPQQVQFNGSQPVTIQPNSPPFWMVANKQPLPISVSIVGAGTQTLVNGVAGQFVTLHYIQLWSDAAAATLIRLQDSNGNDKAIGRNNGAGLIMQTEFHASKLDLAVGVQLGGLSGPASSNFFGTLVFSQN